MNKQYNELKEKIIEAVPEIMELKFGCVVRDNDYQPREYIYVCEETGQHNNYPKREEDLKKRYIRLQNSYSVGQQSCQVELNFFKKNFKIIGRPVTNDDIQITISKYLKNGDVLNSHINSRGELVLRTNNNLIDLKLGKPLQDQSDECKELLFNLIVKKGGEYND